MATHQLSKQIGLFTGIAFVVGGVIGMGAFVLIPLICAKAYGAAWLSITIAVVINLLRVFPLIQLSAAYPVAGGGYEYGKLFFGRTTGIVFSAWALMGGAASVALVAYGLVESFQTVMHIPLSNHLLSILLILLFWGVFLTGVKTLAALQIAMVVQMLLAILLYTLPTLLEHYNQVQFSLPTEGGSFFMAIVFSFNICLGFQIIMELGEEMEDPKRNIPLSLLIGGGIVWLVYILITAAYIGAVGVENLSLKPEMVSTADAILPAWAIYFVRLGIISAGVTCFVGAGLAIPREVFVLSRDKVLPSKFSEVSKNGTPKHAVNFFFSLVCVLLLVGEVFEQTGILVYFFGKDTIEFYGFLTIIGIMALGGGVSLVALRLQTKMPDALEKAYIKFHPLLLKFLVAISILASLFLIALVSTKWLVPACFAGVTILAMIMAKVLEKDPNL